MLDQAGGAAHLAPILIALVIVVSILLLRNSRPRTLKIERLWLRPVLYALIAGSTVARTPLDLTPLSISICVVALLAGAGLGWQRGKMIKIEVHPETHAVTTRVSAAGMVFILALIGVRFVLGDMGVSNIGGLNLSYATVIDALALLSLAVFVTQAVEMTLRSNRLLAQARAAQSATAQAG